MIVENCDTRYPFNQSIVLRYHKFNRLQLTKDNLEQVSCYQEPVGEGCRLFSLMYYKGIQIDILDESSLMSSGTMKAIDGCLAVADARQKKQSAFVVPSGANTVNAYALYGQRAGINIYSFVPVRNVRFLDYRLFEKPGMHLIGVEDSGILKQAAQYCAELLVRRDALAFDPSAVNLALRLEASRFRGYALAEHIISKHRRYSWIAQAIVGAFGPVGIYEVLEELNVSHNLADYIPRFLGIQQTYNCSLYDRWKGFFVQQNDTMPLNPVMYDPHPLGNSVYAKSSKALFHILHKYKGELLVIKENEFWERFNKNNFHITTLLEQAGMPVTMNGSQPLEVAGLMCLFGILQAIDQQIITEGPVLCLFTGGVSTADPQRHAVFECIINKNEDWHVALQRYLKI